MIDRAGLDRIRGNIGVGQGAVRNADTRSKDMATFGNATQQMGTKPLQTGGYTTPGANGVEWSNPGMQAPAATAGGYIRPQFQNGMSNQQFINSYNTFKQNSAGIPTGMRYGDWMRSGQFFRPSNPFQSSPTSPTTRPTSWQTDPFQGGGNDVKPTKPSPQMNPPGNSGVTRPPKYVAPMFSSASRVGGP